MSEAQRTAGDVAVLASGAALSLAGKGIGQVGHFVTLVAIARVLGPGPLGAYSIGWTVLRLLSLVAPLGLHNAVLHLGPPALAGPPGRFRALVGRALVVTAGVSCLAALLWLAAAEPLAVGVFREPRLAPVFRAFAAGLPFAALLLVAAAATRASRDVRAAVLSEELGQPLIALALVTVLLGAGLGAPALAAATSVSFAVAAAVAYLLLRRLFGPQASSAAPTDSVSSLLGFSLPTALAGVLTMAVIWIDRLFVASFLSLADAGVYQAVSQITLVLPLILTGFNAILTPMIADLYAKEERQRLERLFRVSTKWGIYCIAPLAVWICALPADLITVLFGREYAGGAAALVILIVGQSVNVATGAVGYLLIMTGRPAVWLRLSVVALAVDVALNAALIPIFGLEGAAVATAVAISLLFGAGLLRVRRELAIWPYDRRYLKVGAAILVAAAGGAAAAWAPIAPGAPRLLVGAAAVGVPYLLTLTLMGLDAEDRQVLRQWARRR